MSNQVLVVEAVPICFCVSGSLSPGDPGTDWRGGRSVNNINLTLNALASAAGRQSDKVDLGEKRAPRYAFYGCVNFTGETPVVDTVIEYWWLPSGSSQTADANVYGNSGLDAVAPGGQVPGSMDLDEFKIGGEYIGSLPITDDVAIFNGFVKIYSPPSRYGQLLLINGAGDVMEALDTEHHQLMVPLIDEVQ